MDIRYIGLICFGITILGFGIAAGDTITWAPAASICVSIICFNVAFASVIYRHAKRYGRNAVAWTITFIVFSPLLAVIAYLLTWPKSQQ